MNYKNGGERSRKISEAMKGNRNGINARKFNFNQSIFDIVDSGEKAYWLGFLFADGYITRDKQTPSGVAIKLAAADFGHLEKFKTFLSADYKIRLFSNKIKKNLVNNNYCEIQINSVDFARRLVDLGVVVRKSSKIEFPEYLSTNLYADFIRGVFDGDGCISLGSRTGALFSICGFPDFLRKIQGILIEKCSLNSNKLRCKTDTFGSFSFGGRLQCRRLFDFLYSGASVYLDRKYDKWLELVNYKNKTRSKIVIYQNKQYTLSELSEKFCISKSNIQARLRRGWSLHEALTSPVQFKNHLIND